MQLDACACGVEYCDPCCACVASCVDAALYEELFDLLHGMTSARISADLWRGLSVLRDILLDADGDNIVYFRGSSVTHRARHVTQRARHVTGSRSRQVVLFAPLTHALVWRCT